MWRAEIKPYFQEEAEFLEKYGTKTGYELDHIAKILADQRLLEKLIWHEGDDCVAQFAKFLAAYIQYQEGIFLKRVRQIVEKEPSQPEPA